ncbi:MAG: pyridoxamine 5'-phosphate oxidase family protein [Acidimicrobiales bacterium]
MIDEMTGAEVEEFLLATRVGRVGCRDGEDTYVVPVIYAWHEGCAYAYTTEGKKVDLMRRHPRVCFEVDEYRPDGGWRSVIVQGVYEELDGEGATLTLDLLRARMATTGAAGRGPSREGGAAPGRAPVAFRVRAETLSGRRVERD